MQSTVSEPQALSVTGILDASFRLYRKHFWNYLAIIMIIEIPVLILFGIVSINSNELIPFQNFFTFISGNVIQFFFLTNLVALQPIGAFSVILLMLLLQIRIGFLINATAQIYHTGSTSATQAYRVPIVPIIVIGVLGLISTVFTIIPFLGCIPFLPVLLALPFVCVYQIILLEKPNPFAAIARNWYLIQGSILRIVGLMFLLFILEQVLQAIPSSIFAYMWSLAGLWGILTWIVAAFGYVISLLLLSFSTIVFTLLYFELRARREGYDLELKTQRHFANS